MPLDMRASHDLPSKQMLQLSLWGGIVTLVWILCILAWFKLQAEDIWFNERRESANLMSDSLSRAIQNNLASRNYAELEDHLMLAVSDMRVQSALVADTHGKVLSHVVHDETHQTVKALYSSAPVSPPDQARLLLQSGTTFVQWTRVGNGGPLGWLRLEILATKADQALVELRQRFLLVFGSASFVLLGLLLFVTRRTHQLIRLRESTLLENQELLEEVAYRDSLTQLANRHMLLERLEQEIAGCDRHQEQLMVCFLDLDGFKEINDIHGHDAGDEVLREVARRLTQHVRENDIVARLGGDEFVLVLTRIDDLTQATEVLPRILKAISEPIVVQGTQCVHVSASLGATAYPDDNSSPGVLIEHADHAMYQAKRNGKNKWWRYEERQALT